MATRIGFVAKKWGFLAQNGDEIWFRRQKMGFSASKWRRERVSSSKLRFFQLKMATRTRLVAKKWGFLAQNGDEIWFRRQKMGFSASKWRRERVSSSKLRFFQLKMATRTRLVAKKWGFLAQNGDEIWFRRQNCAFSSSK